jgi:hypothetical protein
LQGTELTVLHRQEGGLMSASAAAVLGNRYRLPNAYEAGVDQPPRRGRIGPGRLVVQRHPQLRGHEGMPPDLVLKWGPMPRTATVDIVVHLHGFWMCGKTMQLHRAMEPRSGLDLADPGLPGSVGRTTPTLLVLPRGNFFGGRTGEGYDFPALRQPGALTALVDDALRRFAAATGVRATRGRLILTAHSGGGSALMAILRHTDPDEVHAFDALYGDPDPLIAWARRRRAAGTGAMRVLFRPGEDTAGNSRRVFDAMGSASPRFRVEETAVAHDAMPRVYGWRLLADPAADLPGAGRPRPPAGGHAGPQRELAAPTATAPALCAAIARVAVEQFRRWRPGGGSALTETSSAASPILREYYRVGIGTTVTDAQMRSTVFQDTHPWSAVFISYVMRTAGAGPAFAYSAAHQTYIRAARQNRLSGNTANPFWAFRATEIAPRVGDLVCAARATSGATYDNIGDPQTRATHSDVVTEVLPGRIRVIGGNVSQTVGEKSLRTLPDGRLDLTGNQSQFFAVIRCRADGAAPPARPPSGPAPAPSLRPGLDARVRSVMDLLVNQYLYPVNAAAGIVGNLIAESAVLPNRIEGSAEATPMRARDFAGRLRDFTPDAVRDRDYRRQSGPRHPGIGLAQWTSPHRRRGLFQHTFRGRQLGSAILSDLPAQVDYLVTELRRDYRQLNALLMAAGTTADQASDAMLLRFERPASVLDKPPTDPGVQAVLIRRRRLAAQALQTYGAARRNWWGGRS